MYNISICYKKEKVELVYTFEFTDFKKVKNLFDFQLLNPTLYKMEIRDINNDIIKEYNKTGENK